MKKIIIITLLLAMSSPAWAGWNLNFFGSNDKQKKNHKRIEQPQPPVNVPEPASIILFGTGLVGIMAASKLRRR